MHRSKDNEVSRALILIWCMEMEDKVLYEKDIAMRIRVGWIKANQRWASCMEDLRWIVV